MDTKMLKKIGSVFKYGARVVQDGQDTKSVIHLSYAEDSDGKPTILAWAYPSKDLYYTVKDVEEREDGWLIHANGTRYLFKPLDKKTGQDLASDMKDA